MAGVRVSLADEIEWSALEGFVQALEKTVGRVRQAAGKTVSVKSESVVQL